MELDVQLTRSGDEAWGFRLVGGVDYGLPLTVMKVLSKSPAERAGLQCGDRVSRLQTSDARHMSHEDAREVMAGAGDSLLIAVQRGLYEPVVDDYEPMYEPVDQDDFDQPSQPTEVQFQIQSFTEVPNYTDKPLEYRDTPVRSLPRSETASPFIVPLKPYRSFSTEPIPQEDVPPLENPIILNPDYQDVFNQHDGDEFFLPKTRFKLPISEQYDPDGTKAKQTEQCQTSISKKSIEELSKKEASCQRKETFVEEVKKEIESQQSKASSFEQIAKEQKITKDEIKFMEKMKQDKDLQKSIFSTAALVVEENLEKAATVAQEIKEEIDYELPATSVNTSFIESKEESKSIVESKHIISETNEPRKVTVETAAKKFIELIDKTGDETDKENRKKSVDVNREIKMFEKIIEEEKSSTEQNVSKVEDKKTVQSRKEDTSISVKDISQKSESNIDSKSQKTEKLQDTVKETSQSMKTSTKVDSQESHDTKSKMSTARLLAEQRAYTIGLQTIPHIRGSLHSSYHYNLLLKTFFIHLTDVMVALSRFILTEPVLPETKEEKTEQVISENKTSETVYHRKEAQDISQSLSQKDRNQTAVKKDEIILESETQHKIVENKAVQKTDEHQKQLDVEVSELTEKRKVSGLVMAQRTERKSADLTEKMDAVITEFQTKSGIEEMEIKEISTEEKCIDQKIESIESKTTESILETSSTAVSSSVSESKTLTESHHEKKESNRKFKEGTPTYVAIVESHVYTNKDVVLEEQFSGLTSQTSSVQSPKETQSTISFSEAEFAKKLLQSSDVKTETAKVAVEESNKMFISSIEEAVNALEKAEINHTVVNFDYVDSKIVVEDAKTVATQEKFQTVEELQEVKDSVKLSDVLEASSVESHISQNEIVSSNTKVLTETIDIQTQSHAEISTKKVDSKISTLMSESVQMLDTTESQKTEVQECSESVQMLDTMESQQLSESSYMKNEISPNIEEQSSKIEAVSQQSKTINLTEHHTEAAFVDSVAVKSESFKAEEKSFTQIEAVKEVKEEAAELKVVKKELVDDIQNIDIQEESNTFISKATEIHEQSQQTYEEHVTSLEEKSFDSLESSEQVQESTFTARSSEAIRLDAKKLTLDLKQETHIDTRCPRSSHSSIPSEISTPTPSHVPPTPLTDEYVFKLEIPLPRGRGGTPYPIEPTLESEVDEDPHIVKKKLIPHIDTTIESKIYDPPLPSPPGDKVTSPVYTKPGLRGGGVLRQNKKEEIREIERKSSLLASAIDETIKNIELYKQQVAQESKKDTQQAMKNKSDKHSSMDVNGQIIYNGYAKVDYKINGNANPAEISAKNGSEETQTIQDIKEDPIIGYRVVPFNPDEIVPLHNYVPPVEIPQPEHHEAYKSATGEVLGSKQGIVDGLEESMVDNDAAKELGKPGMTEDKIAELISGESEMLREAHVMGLSRVLKSHMHRADDDSSVDFKKIKPIIESLKDSEVLRALNDELIKTQEERKKEERKWTTFMQKPRRPVPKAKFGYTGWTSQPEKNVEETSYKVKIVKQPKPKVAPDYKPEDFNTGPLPWEERALNEPPPPPVEAEEPILVPEGTPEFLEAVDPLPESEVPDLEDTGIILPPPKQETEPEEETTEEQQLEDPVEETEVEAVVEETEKIEEEMEVSRVAEQLMSVSNMVDPNAPLEQQLKQMQAQIAALAHLPCVIQQTLELVTKQLSQITNQEKIQNENNASVETGNVTEEDEEAAESQVANENCTTIEEINEENEASEAVVQNGQPEEVASEEPVQTKPNLSEEEMARLKKEEQEMLQEQQRIEKQKKELMDQMRVELNGRQVKQRPTPRVGKPTPAFGPLTPQERPVVLPGGRRWRKPEDAYNEQFIAETLSAQAEIIQGKAKGINFMKYEKPPVSLDHLQYSDTYKMIHNMEQESTRRVDMRTPAYAESDYREKCRSMTPCHGKEQHISIPQQVQP